MKNEIKLNLTVVELVALEQMITAYEPLTEHYIDLRESIRDKVNASIKEFQESIGKDN